MKMTLASYFRPLKHIPTDLEIMSKRSRRYIRSLSEIRNSLVHDIRKVEFTLKEFISDYTEKEIT